MKKLDGKMPIRLLGTLISNDWNLWKRTIMNNQNSKSLFVFGTFYSLHDSNGRTVNEGEVIDWIVEHSTVPELTILSSHISDGLLFSISNPGYVHGYEASNIASQIIEGFPISTIPIDVPKQKAVHINMVRAEQLGATIPVDIIAISNYFNKLGY